MDTVGLRGPSGWDRTLQGGTLVGSRGGPKSRKGCKLRRVVQPFRVALLVLALEV